MKLPKDYIESQTKRGGGSRGSTYSERIKQSISTYGKYFKGKVLDVGCGHGLAIELLQDLGFKCEGLEMVKRKVRITKGYGSKVTMGFQEQMPFKDKEFDTIFASHVLEHSFDVKKAISEYERVSKRAIIIVPIEKGRKPDNVHVGLFENVDEFLKLFKDKGKILLSKSIHRIQDEYIVIVDFYKSSKIKPFKTVKQLKKDWEEAASINNYRNTIAQGCEEEEVFRGLGKKHVNNIMNFAARYHVFFNKKDIVEIGCGAGRMTEFLSKEVNFIYATDISMGMLKRFKERLGSISNVALLCTKGLSVIPSSHVDIILSYLVFQHIPEDMVEDFFKEGYRVLKPGGYFIFQLTNVDKHQVVKSRLGATDMVRWTSKEIETLAKKNNYELVNPVDSIFKIWRKPL